MKDSLPPLRDITPSEIGGRVSRGGFQYQDHVGAHFCLSMLGSDGPEAIWFEQHDDFVLDWQQAGTIYEFVQVKHEDLPSRYSIARITERDGAKEGTSLVERSLARSACREDTRFRLVTSYDVDRVLSILRIAPTERLASHDEKVNSVKDELGKKLGLITAPDGTTLSEWVDRCYWDKRESTIESLAASNQYQLDRLLSNWGFHLAYDQRDEIIARLLMLVQRFSGPEGAKDYIVSKARLEEWLRLQVDRARRVPGQTVGLREKLKQAGLNATIVQAEDLVNEYRYQRRTPSFSSEVPWSHLENEVGAHLNMLRAELDAGSAQNGPDFHLSCLREIREVWQSFASRHESVTFSMVQGIMYDMTDRCTHRFTRPVL